MALDELEDYLSARMHPRQFHDLLNMPMFS